MNDGQVGPRKVATVEELIQEVGVDLLSIHPFSLQAWRDDDFDGTAPDAFEIDHQEGVRFAVAPTKLAVRLIARLSVKGVCSAEIDIAAEYETREPVELSVEAFQGFINRVAVMAIWPFTRQAASDLFLRVAQVAVPLPVLLPNDFVFEPTLPLEDEVEGDTE